MKIVIDGNIGSGKTTQLDLLSSENFQVVKEPIEKWPLDLFYSDPERWGFLFQLIILQTLTCLPTDDMVIYERCPLSSKEIFWKSLKKHYLEDKTYQEEFEKRAWYPDVYIYIDTPAKTCYNNIQSRYQAGDQGVSLEYLQTLEVRYKEMFEGLTTCHRFSVDGNRDVDEVHKDILKIIYKYQ
jgi:deoxyadenosine/deoxycytidine kinase